MISTPCQFKSLASRVRNMHGALDADELAKLLGVAKVTILCRAKRGRFHRFVSARWFALTLKQCLAGCSNKASNLYPFRRTHGKFLIRIVEISGSSRSLSLNKVAFGLPLRRLGPPTSAPSFTWPTIDLNRVEEAMRWNGSSGYKPNDRCLL